MWQKYFSTDTLPYKCRLNRGQKVSYYAYGTHEGIVPKEDFEKANALMKSRAQKITLTKNSPYAFRKKIVCGDCQSLFRRKVVRGITYWVCIGHDKKRHGLKCGITPIAAVPARGATAPAGAARAPLRSIDLSPVIIY